jgi:hypothetical protein
LKQCCLCGIKASSVKERKRKSGVDVECFKQFAFDVIEGWVKNGRLTFFMKDEEKESTHKGKVGAPFWRDCGYGYIAKTGNYHALVLSGMGNFVSLSTPPLTITISQRDISLHTHPAYLIMVFYTTFTERK